MTDERIRVSVASYGDGRNLMLTYIDPITGKKKAKSSGTLDRDKANKAAGVWEDELNTGRYQAPSKLTWKEFRQRYTSEKLATLSRRTLAATSSALNHLERIVNPDRLAKLTPAVLSRFQAALHAEKMKDTTIACHLRHVKAALNWAVSMGLMHAAPKIVMPQRAKGRKLMRGRPITPEEFDRMLAAVPKVRPHDAATWTQFLTGLWLSGLRLGEAVALSWDQDAPLCVWLNARRPALRIYSEAQKAHRDQLLPMTPDFAEWLLATPASKREGQVFKLTVRDHGDGGRPMSADRIGEVVATIGEKAGVVVNREPRWVREPVLDPKTGEPTDATRRVQREVPKYASCHDLRRAFGTRWAPRVKPATLQLLMRHASIDTTLKYYVAQSNDDVADELWAGHWADGNTLAGNASGNLGNTFGNTRPDSTHGKGEDNEANDSATRCQEGT